MNTKQIDYCIELAHTLNFSRAAENMFVSQPTLTYQIKLLEDEVGFAIFERSGKGAALTPAGSQFVTYLANMREEMKRAIEQGQNFSAKYKDNITISLMVRQAVYFLPEAMRLFEEREPGVQITPMFQYENGMKKQISADTFKIEMKDPYSPVYMTCIEEAKKDLRANARPELTNYLDSIDEYDTVILAYPNYWGTMPMAVYTFLERYDFTGKTILPLCTNEGSGMGSSEGNIKKLAPGANVKRGLSITGSNAANAGISVKNWLTDNGLI